MGSGEAIRYMMTTSMMTMSSHASRWTLTAAVPILAGACSGSSPTDPEPAGLARVDFTYQAPVAVSQSVRERFPGCVSGVGRTHIHPSWRGFARIDMIPSGQDGWRISFEDVPTRQQVAVRVSDPNACVRDPNGASTESVFANGARLTRIVSTPGNGVEPGLAFRVAPDGTVTP